MAGRYYVFETQKTQPWEPTRQVSRKPATLKRAKQLARIGAQHGTQHRVVTLSPKAKSWKAPEYYYEAGSGEKVHF
jgi:hypothetical protein